MLSRASNVLGLPIGQYLTLHELFGPSEFLLSLLLVFGLCFWLLWLWSCSIGSSLCVPVRLPLEALSMSFDDLSTCIQVLSDTWKTGQQRLFRSWWLTMAKCSWAGLGWAGNSLAKGPAELSPDLRCVFFQFPPDLASAEMGDNPYL